MKKNNILILVLVGLVLLFVTPNYFKSIAVLSLSGYSV